MYINNEVINRKDGQLDSALVNHEAERSMRKITAATGALASAMAALPSMAETYPQVSAMFAATEQRSGNSETPAYEFYLDCGPTACRVERTIYDVCKMESELKVPVMQVINHRYSTADGSLRVERLPSRGEWQLIEIKFGSPPAYGGLTDIKLEVRPDAIVGEIRNMAGSIEQVFVATGQRTVTALSPTPRPGRPLQRSCPVILKSFLK